MIYEKVVTQMGEDWATLLKDFMVGTNCEFDKITAFLKSQKEGGKNILPEGKLLFRAFRETSLIDTRVILLGQDPYPKPGVPNGLAFGTDTDKMPPSLEYIVKGIEDDAHNGLDLNRDLIDKTLVPWARQGVLLLNSALTVRSEEPASHSDIWKPFTEFVLQAIQSHSRDKIFVGIGKPAQVLLEKVNPFRHFVFTTEHPAFAAREKRAWKHNHIFTSVNLCIKMNRLGDPIKWSV